MDYAQAGDEVRAVTRRVAELLEAAPSTAAPVAGLEWTVGELGAHLVELTTRYRGFLTGETAAFPRQQGSTHAGMAAWNRQRFEEVVTERDPGRLATMLVGGVDALLDALGPDGERHMAWFDWEARVEDVVGVALGELLVHGLDLARTVRSDWPITRAQALAVFDGLVGLLPFVARPETCRAIKPATIHVHLRGGGDYGFHVADAGIAVSREEPASADLHVSADPVANLLVGYGRKSRWSALARGQILAWGRKPWLALRFADLFERP